MLTILSAMNSMMNLQDEEFNIQTASEYGSHRDYNITIQKTNLNDANYEKKEGKEKEEIQEKLEEEFRHKYITGNHVKEHFNKYTEDGIGSKEVLEFPDTPLHRQLYPELYNFEFYGFACYIVRNFSASWCGYVKTEKNHPLWEHADNEDYIENTINVHGGITYIHSKEFTIQFNRILSMQKPFFPGYTEQTTSAA